jgi:hypothetical protein
MARGAWTAFTLILVASGTSQAEAPLPLRRVRLYEVGVGYFERQGNFDAQRSVTLPVPATHLDDALKTLVVLNTDGKAQVSGIEFSSVTSRSLARALAGLPASEDTALDYLTLLRSLKGAPVEVRAKGERLRGRVVDVLEPDQGVLETCTTSSDNKPEDSVECPEKQQATVLLLTDSSELRRLIASQIESVHPLSPGATTRIEAALDAVSKRGAQGARGLRVLAKQGQAVTLGYVAETPVWRSSYRLVLDQNDAAILSGWALIHNDTEEAWKGVKVELVNGQPDSYLFPLAAPRYARRALITPNQEMSTVPQLLDKPVDEMWATGDDEFGAGGLGLSGIGEGGGGRGEGIGLGSIGTHYSALDTTEPTASAAPLADIPESVGVESGALFSYSISTPVELRAHGSALVPFVQVSTAARRTAWFNTPGSTARSAVYVTNQTKQTLPPGTIAIYADGGFAGESVLQRLKPGQSQLISHGTELDVQFESTGEDAKDFSVRFTMTEKRLNEHFLRLHDNRYTLTNNSGTARTAYLSLPFVPNATVTGPDETRDDGTLKNHYAVYQVEAQKKRIVSLHAEEALVRSFELSSITIEQLRQWSQSKRLVVPQQKLVALIIQHRLAAQASREHCTREDAELTAVRGEIAEVREDLKALRDPDSDEAETLTERLVKLSNDRQKRQISVAACRSATSRAEAAIMTTFEQLGNTP